MSDMPHVKVLLATFQGERYLPQQVDSIVAQTGVAVSIVARDDGSTDGTASQLEQCAQAGKLHLLTTQAGTGSATGNFRALLLQSKAAYVALADQDDVWEPTKLARSMQLMCSLEERHGAETPLLVFSDLAVVDENLHPVAPSLWQTNGLDPRNVRRLGRLLGENVVTGCTALLNRPLAALAAQMPQPPENDPLALQHDHCIALLACTLGHAAWLPDATVLYRQHATNVLGAASGGSVLQRLLSQQALLARKRAKRSLQQQAQQFLDTYGNLLTEEQRKIIRGFLLSPSSSPMHRLIAMTRFGFWRGTAAKNLLAVLDLVR